MRTQEKTQTWGSATRKDVEKERKEKKDPNGSQERKEGRIPG